MLKLEEIKKDLRRGDYSLIQQMVSKPGEKPVSMDTINSIFQGRRSAETEYAQTVLSAAQKLIANRKQLLETTPPLAVQIQRQNSKKSPNQTELFSPGTDGKGRTETGA